MGRGPAAPAATVADAAPADPLDPVPSVVSPLRWKSDLVFDGKKSHIMFTTVAFDAV